LLRPKKSLEPFINTQGFVDDQQNQQTIKDQTQAIAKPINDQKQNSTINHQQTSPPLSPSRHGGPEGQPDASNVEKRQLYDPPARERD
jgi:hypothetical protein